MSQPIPIRHQRTRADLSGDPHTLHVMGMDKGDEFFSNDHGAWNVTRAIALCESGRAGQVWGMKFRPLWFEPGNASKMEVEPAKLEALRKTEWWARPVIHVMHGPPQPEGDVVYLIDGVHRLNLWATVRPFPDIVPGFVLSRELARQVAVQFVTGDGRALDPRKLMEGESCPIG